MSKYSQRPPVVDEIAGQLTCVVAFFMFPTILAVCVWFLLLSQLGLERMFTEAGHLTCGTTVAVVLSAFFFVLLRDFRRMKKWTYSYVGFLCFWSTLALSTGFGRKLQQKDVRRAFGIEDELDSIEDERK